MLRNLIASILDKETDHTLIAIHDQDGCYQSFNELAFNRQGFDVSDMLGANWREFVYPDEREDEEAILAKVAETGHSFCGVIARRWGGERSELVTEISLLKGHGRKKLFMRRGVVLPVEKSSRSLVNSQRGQELEALQHLRKHIDVAIGLASSKRLTPLRRMLELAEDEARLARERCMN